MTVNNAKRITPRSIRRPFGMIITMFRSWIRKRESKSYTIIQHPEKELNVVYKIKDASWDNIYYPECYGHSKEAQLTVHTPAEYIFLENNAIVSGDSDVVLTSKGAYWNKFNQEEFVTWAKPADKNVAWFNRSHIGVVPHKKQEIVNGKVLSLIGLWSYHWAHCLFEFLPKLFSAGKAGLLNQPITLLVVENEDSNIKEIMNNYLSDYPQANILWVKNDVDYICEELYFLPIPGPSYCDYKFRLDYVEFIPRYVIDDIKRYVIDPVIEKVKDNKPKYEKIFLPRTKKFTHTGKLLINYDEIHDYFKSLGYIDLEGSTMTLEEKADVFYHAKEVVGMYGSSLVNLMFCNHAKCINLSNYKFVTETCIYLLNRDYLSKMITVTGQDDGSEYGSNFYIPLDKIKSAYQYCMLDKQ